MRVIVFSLLLSSACAPARSAAPAAAPAPSMAEVSRMLDDWHDAAAKADEERYFGHFAEGAVFMGTDATERWTLPQLRAYAHPHFAKGKAWSFRSTRRDVTFRGDVAWFDEDLATPNLGPARGSGVVIWDEKGCRCWKIAHYNLTITVPNERMKEVKALLEEAKPAAPDGAP
jgi:hypothetical protein